MNRDDIFIINKKDRPCDDYGAEWNDRNIRCALENTLKMCKKYLEKKDKQ